MNEYELTYIRKIGLDQDVVEKMESRITQAFEKNGGVVLQIQDMGEMQLAYVIKKESKGQYIKISFVGTGALVDELERQFRISADVLRFLTVKLASNVDPEQKKKEYAESKPAPAPKEPEEEPAAEEQSAIA